jgi:hypothetical protein
MAIYYRYITIIAKLMVFIDMLLILFPHRIKSNKVPHSSKGYHETTLHGIALNIAYVAPTTGIRTTILFDLPMVGGPQCHYICIRYHESPSSGSELFILLDLFSIFLRIYV